MNTSVTVVIPTFNAAQYVTEAIDSVLGQTIATAEIVVVDDGSTDDTAFRLRPYADRVRYVHQKNLGVSSARNRGIAEARGDYIAFLDADDVWHPDKLRVQTEVLAASPEAGAVSTQRFDWPADRWPPLPADGSPPPVSQVSWSGLALRNGLDTSSIVVRRDILERVGPFDTQLQGPEDHDLWLRLVEVTTVLHVGLPLTGYRNAPGSLSKQADRMLRDKYRMLSKQTARPAWKGRHLLRRKAYSLVNYSCFHMYTEAGRYGPALLCLLRSLLWYPAPYRLSDTNRRFARPKAVVLTLTRWARAGISRPALPGRLTGRPK